MLRELLEKGRVLDIVEVFLAFALIVSAVFCLAYIIFGGISFILSAGNEDKIKAAVNTIRYAIFGLFVSFFAFFVVSMVTKLLDIPFELSFSDVITLMGDIFKALR